MTLGFGVLPPTPASTARTKRTVNLNLTAQDLLSVQAEDHDQQDHHVEQDVVEVTESAPGRTRRAGLMFSKRMGLDGVWYTESSAHQLGSGVSGKRCLATASSSVAGSPKSSSPDSVPTGSSSLAGPSSSRAHHKQWLASVPEEEDEEEGEATIESSHSLLKAPCIPGVRKGNSFLQQLEAVAAGADDRTAKSSRQAIVAKSSTKDLSTATFWGPSATSTADKTIPDEDDSEDEGRTLKHVARGERLPSPVGLIDFTKALDNKTGPFNVVKPASKSTQTISTDCKNPFDESSRSLSPPPIRQDLFSSPSASTSAHASSSTSTSHRNKKKWPKPVSGGEDDPFAEKPGDFERMRQRQREFVKRDELPYMGFLL